MKLHWFVPSLISIFWLAAPAKAGQLTTWQYDANQNRLEFTTDEDVQPRAQLVFDPTRLVIDLPATHLGQAPVNQTIGGVIQQVRIGQLDSQTTRIVIELASGYVIDPQQVRFRGLSPTQWTVQLPQPQLATAQPQTSTQAASETPSAPARSSIPNSTRRAAGNSPAPSTTTSETTSETARASRSTPARSSSRSSRSTPQLAQIDAVEVTDEGLRVSTEGNAPKVSVQRSRSGRTVTIRIEKAQLSAQLNDREREINRHGIDELEIDQDEDGVEIKLDVSRRSPDWDAEVTQGEILLLPETAVAEKTSEADPQPPNRTVDRATQTVPPLARLSPTNLSPANLSSANAPAALPQAGSTVVAEQPSPARTSTSPAAPRVQLATVQGIDLDLSASQLLIQTDRPVSHQAQWQGGVYVLTLSPARLAARVTGPQLTATDPLRRVRLRQVDDQTVAVSIQPATGVQFGALNLITPQMLALSMQRSTASTPRSLSAANPAALSLPNRASTGRLLVVIDPGHGGNDVGAVGIGGLHEADVVLAIAQQVATLLEHQGIQAVLTRSSDVEIDLEPRVRMAEQMGATLFVSIHANSMGMDRPEVNGTETYYYSSGAALAETIQNSIIGGLGVNDRGTRQARFYVLRETSMPAVLVETGFVTGNQDAPRLANTGFQSQMATAIARGILQYIQQQAMVGGR